MDTATRPVFCGTQGVFCSVGCQVRGEHRDWALTDPWVLVPARRPIWGVDFPVRASDLGGERAAAYKVTYTTESGDTTPPTVRAAH